MSKQFIVEYTNKDIMAKLESIERKLENKADIKLVYAIIGFIATSFVSYVLFVL